MCNDLQCPKCSQMTKIGYCPACDYDFQAEYFKKQSKATSLVSKAIAAGQLTRPKSCELCESIRLSGLIPIIVAHHWNGYDDPLNVWWICRSCNGILGGRKYHNGSVSKEQARQVIRDDLATRIPMP